MNIKKIILFEGVDGVGKTTIGKRLAKLTGGIYLYSPPKILGLIRKQINSYSECTQYCYYLIANQMISDDLKGSSEKIIVLDRYYYSTLAFFGVKFGRHLFLPEFTNLIEPDSIIYLAASWDVIEYRLIKRGENKKHEKKEFLMKLDKEYQYLLKEKEVWHIDTSQTQVDEVAMKIFKEIF